MKNINEIREYVINNEEEVSNKLASEHDVEIFFYIDIDFLIYSYVVSMLKNINVEEVSSIDSETIAYVYENCWSDWDDESYNIPDAVRNAIIERARFSF